MNQKKFEYQNKDIPMLRKDIRFRVLFLALFFAVFALQIASLLVNYFKDTLTKTLIFSGAIILSVSLLFIVMSLSFIFKSMRILDGVKKSGYVVSSVTTLPSLEKRSFINLYSFICNLLAVVSLLAFVCGLTYAYLQFSYYSTVSAYLPLLLLFAIIGFNTTYHVSHEIDVTKNVREYHST